MIIEEKELRKIEGLGDHFNKWAALNPSLFDGSLKVGDEIWVKWINLREERAIVVGLNKEGSVELLDWPDDKGEEEE